MLPLDVLLPSLRSCCCTTNKAGCQNFHDRPAPMSGSIAEHRCPLSQYTVHTARLKWKTEQRKGLICLLGVLLFLFFFNTLHRKVGLEHPTITTSMPGKHYTHSASQGTQPQPALCKAVLTWTNQDRNSFLESE